MAVESKCNEQNSDELEGIPEPEKKRRRSETLERSKKIHGNKESAINGMWHTLAKNSTKPQFKSIITSSAAVKQLLPILAKEERLRFEESEQNYLDSMTVLYNKGIISRDKYISDAQVIKSRPNSPKLIPYNKLVKYIEEKVESIPITELSCISGVQRDLKNLLLNLAQMHLKCIPEKITWYTEPGVFHYSYGADGAPMSKSTEATSFLIGCLNLQDFVQSCDHNYFLLGGYTKEGCIAFMNVLKELAVDMQTVEAMEFRIDGFEHTVKFVFSEFLSDMKFLSHASGQLNNASRFPSPFGNVELDEIGDISLLSKKFGEGEHWEPWDPDEIEQVVKSVKKFKQSLKPTLKEKTKRKKVLDYMAEVLQTRQEEMPYLGAYCQFRRPDPLHIRNICCQSFHGLVLDNVYKNTDDEILKEFDGDVDKMDDCPLKRHLLTLKEMKANLLYRKIVQWLQNSKAGKFEYRFNGETSQKVISNYHLITPDIKNPQYRAGIAHLGHLLRDISKEISLVKVDDSYVEDLERKCRSYYILKSLLTESVKLSDWTLAYPLPYHAKQVYEVYGTGYGLISMQGREAKHQRIKGYIQHTRRDKSTWSKVSKHEHIGTIYLPQANPDMKFFRVPKSRISERFVPELKPNQCVCGNMKMDGQCLVCTSPLMHEIKESIRLLKLTPTAKANMK